MEKLMRSDESTCGESTGGLFSSNADREGYIVGGRDATKGEFPWQVI